MSVSCVCVSCVCVRVCVRACVRATSSIWRQRSTWLSSKEHLHLASHGVFAHHLLPGGLASPIEFGRSMLSFFCQEQCDLQGPFEIATIMQDHRVATLQPGPSIHTPPRPFWVGCFMCKPLRSQPPALDLG